MSTDLRRQLRIVVASPGDVEAERNVVSRVVDDLNHTLAEPFGYSLYPLRWETDTYPGFHAEGPQGQVDVHLKIDQCDLLIGVFWRKFGTPTVDAGSGTEHEIRIAYEAWKAKGSPHLMVYFNSKQYSPQEPKELDQWKKVVEFRQNFPKEGLWWPYRGTAEFERLVRNHLTRFLVERSVRDEPFRMLHSAQEIQQTNVAIVKEASEVLFTTGSRSRDASYLEAIEQQLVGKPGLVHYRVLFGPPHKAVFRDHLARLLEIRSPADRSLGYKTIHIGLYDDTSRQFEAGVLGNEKRALLVLPSFESLGGYDTAMVFANERDVNGLLGFVRQLYAAGRKLETPESIAQLELSTASGGGAQP